jgi:hypothetical protein
VHELIARERSILWFVESVSAAEVGDSLEGNFIGCRNQTDPAERNPAAGPPLGRFLICDAPGYCTGLLYLAVRIAWLRLGVR